MREGEGQWKDKDSPASNKRDRQTDGEKEKRDGRTNRQPDHQPKKTGVETNRQIVRQFNRHVLDKETDMQRTKEGDGNEKGQFLF